MKHILKFSSFLLIGSILFTSCKKDNTVADEISSETLSQIAAHGFGTSNVQKAADGFIVEGDILLTPEFLSTAPAGNLLRIAETEQYRTTNLVKSLPRTITVSVSGTLAGIAVWSAATDAMISRYNAQNLTIKLQRVSSNGDVDIVGFNQAPSGGYITLGSAGFPTRRGDPYGQIKMNTNQYAYGTNPNQGYVTSVLQHEMGHCIGFRHTDYFNRALSCGGAASNEGASNVGAIHIPGTPTGNDGTSFMVSCSNGQDRTFNNNDKIALGYLY